MRFYSTREAARILAIPYSTLANYITVGKVPGPKPKVAGAAAQIWSEEEIEHVRKLLPKIANGRKTRYKKQPAKAKTKKPKKK